MDIEEIRLECLKLARGDFPSCIDSQTIAERAKPYLDFMLGNDKAPEPVQAKPATPESDADPRNPSVPIDPLDDLARA
jgi:hypothetical protein